MIGLFYLKSNRKNWNGLCCCEENIIVMKEFKTIAFTVGVGSAMVLLLSRTLSRRPFSRLIKKTREMIVEKNQLIDEDNDMRYI